MDQTMVTAADLANVINNAGRALDWTRSYRNVAGTTIGAAYRATGLDENTAEIAVEAECDENNECAWGG